MICTQCNNILLHQMRIVGNFQFHCTHPKIRMYYFVFCSQRCIMYSYLGILNIFSIMGYKQNIYFQSLTDKIGSIMHKLFIAMFSSFNKTYNHQGKACIDLLLLKNNFKYKLCNFKSFDIIGSFLYNLC